MYKIYEVSSNSLRKDLKDYEKLREKRFSMSVHIARSGIERHADEILTNFRNGNLILKSDQYALFARYIAKFCNENVQEECFDLLQKNADFDVRAVAFQADDRSWWQKIFTKKEGGIKYLPASKLNKMTDKFIKTHREMEHSQYGKPWLGAVTEKLANDADVYIKAYLAGKFSIEEQDAVAFSRFIKVMEYPLYEGSVGEQALLKLQNEHGQTLEAEKTQTKAVKVPLWTRVKQAAGARIESLKNNNSWYGKAAVGLVGLVTVGALWLGFKDQPSKSDNITLNDRKIDKTEIQNQQEKTNQADEKTFHFSFVANDEYKSTYADKAISSSNTFKKLKTEAQQVKSDVLDSLSLARVNHHKYILKMRLGQKKSSRLIADVQYQIDHKIFSLPKDLCAEDFAYALEMYRAYGVDASLDEALQCQKKLSVVENQKIVKDIVAAGPTGLGVKKMAAALNGGKLSLRSVYDRASKKSQKQYNINMRNWHKLQKQSSNAA